MNKDKKDNGRKMPYYLFPEVNNHVWWRNIFCKDGQNNSCTRVVVVVPASFHELNKKNDETAMLDKPIV